MSGPRRPRSHAEVGVAGLDPELLVAHRRARSQARQQQQSGSHHARLGRETATPRSRSSTVSRTFARGELDDRNGAIHPGGVASVAREGREDPVGQPLDENPDNPANREGIDRWPVVLELSNPATASGALALGRVALAEFNRPKSPGTVNVAGGYIMDGQNNFSPLTRSRAGQTLSIADLPNESPRLITATSWSKDGVLAKSPWSNHPRGSTPFWLGSQSRRPPQGFAHGSGMAAAGAGMTEAVIDE